MQDYNIIGIDGGATHTHAVLFHESGKSAAALTGEGTSLTVYPEKAQETLSRMILDLCRKNKITLAEIDAVGIGVAGASDDDGRDRLFGVLDQLGLSRRALILSDTEAAFEVGVPGLQGFLISVGTGMMCLGRNSEGKYFRTGGRGHQTGDIGSSYWIGRTAILRIGLNEAAIDGDPDLEGLADTILSSLGGSDFETAVRDAAENEYSVRNIARLAPAIIQLAENGNDSALSILQEGSQGIADHIVELCAGMGYSEPDIVLAGNGSLIKNNFYRSLVNDALRFDFQKISWTFSEISPAYGAGLLAARLIDVEIDLRNIVKEGAIARTPS